LGIFFKQSPLFRIVTFDVLVVLPTHQRASGLLREFSLCIAAKTSELWSAADNSGKVGTNHS